MINLKCKCVPSVFNQLTAKITFAGNLMLFFFLPVPPFSSYYQSYIIMYGLECNGHNKLHAFDLESVNVCVTYIRFFSNSRSSRGVGWRLKDGANVGRED